MTNFVFADNSNGVPRAESVLASEDVTVFKSTKLATVPSQMRKDYNSLSSVLLVSTLLSVPS